MPVDFLDIHIFAVLLGCPVVTSDRTHTFRACLKDNFCVETSVKMNYCSDIHHREYTFILKFLLNTIL